jgi:hypothetical protein
MTGLDSVSEPIKLKIVPTTLEEANAFVLEHHRHHSPVRGHKFSIAIADENGVVRGVAIVGRPVSRHRDDGWTLEVNRCCTDGALNACSMLYGACRRAAFAMGFTKLLTYTLPEEGGASLRGAGYRLIGQNQGGNWNVPSRPRVDTDALLKGQKSIWEAVV